MKTNSEFIKSTTEIIKMTPKKFGNVDEYWKERKRIEREIVTRLTLLRKQGEGLMRLVKLMDDQGL